MKIMHIISSPASGGAESYVRDLGIAIKNCGNNVTIVFLSSAAEAGRDLKYEEVFLKELTGSGVTYAFIGSKARSNPLFGIIKLRSIISSVKPDIIHSHLFYGAIFSLFSRTAKKVYTHHSININKPRLIVRLIEERMDAIVAISKECNKSLQAVMSRKITRIDNGVSTRRLNKKEYNPKSEDLKVAPTVTIISIGRLSKQKHLELLITAIHRIQEFTIRLKIVGEGPCETYLKRMVSELDLNNCIEFIGNVSNVSRILYQADIFAMSSKWEGLPISLIEATLSGLPVIVTDVGGCAEVVNKCNNGLIVNSFCANEYSEKLKILVKSASTRRAYGLNGLMYGKKYYSIGRATHDHLRLYRNLADIK